jgi:hypothetical protein
MSSRSWAVRSPVWTKSDQKTMVQRYKPRRYEENEENHKESAPNHPSRSSFLRGLYQSLSFRFGLRMAVETDPPRIVKNEMRNSLCSAFFFLPCLQKRYALTEWRTVQHRERQRPSITDRSLCSNARPLPLPLLYLMSRCCYGVNIAEFTPRGYYKGHKLGVTNVTARRVPRQ